MTATMKSIHVSVTIEKPAQRVYDYVSDLNRFPDWATSFCLAVAPAADGWWEMQTPEGPMNIRFVERNDYGVLDHYVDTGRGEPVLNPMRVIANGSGAEVVFAVFQQPGVPDDSFERDVAMIRRDLETLKSVLER
ncbi:SRPBCC family protein [Paenibacillus doosanensis]|uniref:SRPBCC family protein n=1 Tax=Paenibacillus doosanensis TaxID=1229154 RepID=UPI00217FC253|nr:SRPBCC family protein [Paenibacillus doosanensis]